MKEEYVSLIVPCYNVAKTLQAFIDSVLQQTYPYIQIIAVNDGSTDQTEAIWKFNTDAFQARNILFTYVNQENAGLGAAINTGLKHIDGEYLCWADPDDFYMPDSFEKRVNALSEHPDCGVVTSDANYYRADDLTHSISKASDGMIHSSEPMQFEYLLKEQSIFCPGCHMVRMSAFDDVNPEHDIYPARRGQNWQMLLPIYYKYPRFFISEPLYGYVIYPKSMSQGDANLEQHLMRLDEHETIILETLKRMQIDDSTRKKYLHDVSVYFSKKRFHASVDFRDKKQMAVQYEALCQLHADTDDIRKRYIRNRNLFNKIIGKIEDYSNK